MATYYNWIQRFKLYGFRNVIVLKSGLKKDKTFALRYNKHNFYLRGNAVDFMVFHNIIGKGEYEFKLDFEPRFILDAGANIGVSTLYFKLKYPEAKIVAIEPELSNFDLLVRNLRPYDQVVCINGGVWGEDTDLQIPNPEAEKYAFRVEENKKGDSSFPGYTIETIMKLYQIPYIDILKMDIEGAEFSVFINNPMIWLRKIRVLIIELHDFIKPGMTDLFFGVLDQIEYEIVRKGENLIIINKDFIAD